MTPASRSRSTSALLRRLAPLLAAIGAMLALPASAGAIVEKVESAGKLEAEVGLQPRSTELFPGGTLETGVPLYSEHPALPETFANPRGAPVLSSSRIYAIYWDPTGSYDGDWQGVIDTFLHGMSAESGSLYSVFAVDSQYTDATNQHASYNSALAGTLTDTEPYPASICKDPQPLKGTRFPGHQPNAIACLTDKQMRAALEQFIAQHQLPKGMGTIYYLLTPPGVTVCLDSTGGPGGHCSDFEHTSEESYEHSFCSYHADINPDNAPDGDANTVLYAVVPWTAGLYPDGHYGDTLEEADFACQDGGYDPSSKPIEEFESKEPGPHAEEPQQTPGEVGPDGYYDTGLADLIVNQIAVEQQNTVTDPLLNGWQDSVGNEATDECRNWFASDELGGSSTEVEETKAGTLFNQTLAGENYYLNDAFDLAALKLPYPGVPCLPGVRLIPKFTAPSRVNSGELVGFDGMESDIALDAGTAYNAKGEPQNTYPTYTWNFGDGSPTVSGYAPGQAPGNPPSQLCSTEWLAPCAGSTFHAYTYGGTYTVTLTITDVGGETASASEQVTVDGPPAPSAASAQAGAAAGATGGAGAANGTGGSASSLPAPVAKAAALGGSLKQVASKGLVVSYSVNEQVAGRFEVLLEASLARRLGIRAPQAAGLPAGSPKSLVIGRALLETTKGGHSSVRIKFAKSIALRLRRAHGKVKLTLRLTAHNASSQQPLFTTVMSTVELHR